MNILIVDDKQENLVVLEELLRQPDRQLFTATSGNEALRLLLRHEFAVVLLDVEMPGMDGYETAELMRSMERASVIPIIFVTAGDRSEERTFRGYVAGAVDFLYKPINAFTLRCKVDVFVDLYRKTQQLAALNTTLETASQALRDKLTDLEHVNRTLSHDLRAPLRSIRGFSSVLAESLQGTSNPEASKHLDRILRAGERMSLMLDDLFDLLRIGAIDPTLADVDTAKALAGIVENLRSDIEKAGAVVTHEGLPSIKSNRALLGQVFQNLIVNAIKFRGESEPKIHVSASHTPEAWQFSVRDNGIGVRAEDRERVFGLFERVNGDGSGGAGVGLALCKRAVERLGGRIWIDPPTTTGTTFCFTVRT